MGYNSVVVILNDHLSEIENDPEFGKKLCAAIRRFPIRNFAGVVMPYITGQTEVIGVEHADVLQIVAVGGNTGRTIGSTYLMRDDDQIIKRLNRARLSRAKLVRESAE